MLRHVSNPLNHRVSLAFFSSTRMANRPFSFFKRKMSTELHQQVQLDVETHYRNLCAQSSASTEIESNFIRQTVDRYGTADPSSLAISCIDPDRSKIRIEISYGELMLRSQQVAGFLESKGVKKGDAVALMLGQQPAWWYSLAGLMRQGIVVVPCSRLHTSRDMQYRINDLGIRGVIATADFQERIDVIRNTCSTLNTTLTTGPSNANWDSLLDIFDKDVIPTSDVKTTTRDPAVALYTSGTTGHPKAVIHGHGYPFVHWRSGHQWLCATPKDLVFNASDTGWGFSVWTTLAAWSMGAKILIAPTSGKFEPQKMLALLRDQPITIFCAAPTVLRKLVAEPNFSEYKFPHLRRIVTVGEALDETVIQQFASLGIEVAVGYGQAETPLLIGRINNQPHIPGAVGKPLEPYKIAILDDNSVSLPPNNIGHIAVDISNGTRFGLMREYANAPEKTKKAFSSDGRYYLTGDLGKYNIDGSITVFGRGDDVIKAQGYRIGPYEVEEAGMSHPAVAKIAVVGVPREHGSLDTIVKAFILLKPGYSQNNDLVLDIQEHIRKETAPYKYPRKIEFLDLKDWEQYETTSGKIRRAGLRLREEARLAEVARETNLHMDISCSR